MDEHAEHPALRRTRRFYEWEILGRGWLRAGFPVELEPPFRPFVREADRQLPAADDARRPTALSRFIESLQGRAAPAVPAPPPQTEEVALAPFASAEPAVELMLSLPPGTTVGRERVEAWLLALGSLASPVAFELVGSDGLASMRLAPRAEDREHLAATVRSFFPDASLAPPEMSLAELWNGTFGRVEVAEFGLAREFVLPLRVGRGLDPDPLTALVAALGGLLPGEVALLQVLLTRAAAPWAESILRAVTTPAGEPFFADAPEITKQAREKVATPLFAVVLRLAARSPRSGRTWEILKRLAGALQVFDDPLGNVLLPLEGGDELDRDLLERRSRRTGMLLSLRELAEIVHPPAASLQTPVLWRQSGRTKEPPPEALGGGLHLGENVHNGVRRAVGLGEHARMRHTHVVGASGTGKSTLLASMILDDLAAGRGVALVDPHGDLVEEILGRLPPEREADLVLFDPADPEVSAGWNILEARGEWERNMLASDLVSVFRRLSTAWGDKMTAVLGNAILTLLESPLPATLADLVRFLRDPGVREEFLAGVDDPYLAAFWREDFPKMRGNPEEPLLTRLNAFLRSRLIREVLSEVRTGIDFRSLVDRGGVLLAKLSQGAIGEENSSLLGSLLVAKLHQAALTREELRPEARRPFYLYLDEFHLFATASMANLFAGVRKFRLAVTVAHQDLHQLRDALPEVEHAVTSNAYTRVIFRVGEEDARRLAGGLSWFRAEDLLGLDTGEAVVRLGRQAADFNLETRLLPEVPAEDHEERRRELREMLRRRQPPPKATPPQKSPYAEPPTSPSEQGEETLVPVEEGETEAPPAPPPRKPTSEPRLTKEELDYLELVAAEPFLSTRERNARIGLSAWKGHQVQTALLGQGLARQVAVNPGGRGERFVLLELTREGRDLLAGYGVRIVSGHGRGGLVHQWWTRTVADWLEDQGVSAVVEDEARGARVDVSLEVDSTPVAVEVELSEGHALENIRKDLAAGFAEVVALFDDPAALERVRERLAAEMGDGEAAIHLVELRDFRSALAPLTGVSSALRDPNQDEEPRALRRHRRRREPLPTPRERSPSLLGEPGALTTPAAAEYLSLSPATLETMRTRGGGPVFVKLGRRVVYRREDLDEWLEARRRTSTSDPGSGPE